VDYETAVLDFMNMMHKKVIKVMPVADAERLHCGIWRGNVRSEIWTGLQTIINRKDDTNIGVSLANLDKAIKEAKTGTSVNEFTGGIYDL
jgi:hypothetical protein